jgi:hypothetical protein
MTKEITRLKLETSLPVIRARAYHAVVNRLVDEASAVASGGLPNVFGMRHRGAMPDRE